LGVPYNSNQNDSLLNDIKKKLIYSTNIAGVPIISVKKVKNYDGKDDVLNNMV
jgi:hypothetical protein